MKNKTFFGSGLSQFKTKNRYTLKEMSLKTGFSISYLSEIMRGVKSPNEDIMIKLCDPFELLIEDVIANGRLILKDYGETL